MATSDGPDINRWDQLNPSPCTAAGGGTCSTCRCLKKWPGGIAGVFWELQQAGALSAKEISHDSSRFSGCNSQKTALLRTSSVETLLSHYKTKHPTKTIHKGPPELGHSSHRCTVWMAPARLHWLGSMRLMDGLTSKTIALKCKFLLPQIWLGILHFTQGSKRSSITHSTIVSWEPMNWSWAFERCNAR